MLVDLVEWMNEMTGFDSVWYAKRLSGNDTLANGTHQAGPYVPKEFLFEIFPEMNRPGDINPDIWFDMAIDSHADYRSVRAIWYNNKLRGGTRNEARITQLGGSNSALLDPESTGALAIFAFMSSEDGAIICHVWVCRNVLEEDLVEDKIGPVEPGQWTIWSPGREIRGGPRETRGVGIPRRTCWLSPSEIPSGWLQQFPTGAEIIERAIALRSDLAMNVDRRILRRRECEYEVFLSVEEAVELPSIREGFSNINEFVAKAQTILQRRKARAGRSLELHARAIFIEEGFRENVDFSYNCESEPGKRPDFIFPSETAYKNVSYAASKLRMLAVKTTCKDRWRQILNEADRIDTKHLLTLQEGVSINQFQEMKNANVTLVVPEPLITKYPRTIQPELQTLESFMGDVRLLSA